jgi:peptidoglycan/LPS O-acetylase OafA/YrhL
VRDDGDERDRSIDAFRAVAIAGVVLGHWLVTAVVPQAADGWRVDSPLRNLPWLAPATWLLQTLGVFFFVAGYAAARSAETAEARGEPYGRWVAVRLRRLTAAAASLAMPWLVALAVAAIAGVPSGTLHTAAELVISPLWFLVPLAVLTALVRPVRRAARRWGMATALPAVGVVSASDAGLGWTPLTVIAAWLVPFLLGTLAADRRPPVRSGWPLLLAGAATLAVLVLVAGYPPSAVGVPGEGRSNLNPPSLVAVALAVAQVGLAQLARGKLERWSPPAFRRVVDATNRYAMSIFLWHQSALIAVTGTGLWLAGTAVLPGLHTSPADHNWLLARLAWLPVFAIALTAVIGLPARRLRYGRGVPGPPTDGGDRCAR